ncbi:MAG: MotA/TolQ/ExbB proton channel family protein [Bacteroidales bacterium]
MFLQIVQGSSVADTVAALQENIQQLSSSVNVVPGQESIPIFELALKGGWLMIPLVILLLVTVYVFVERSIVIGKAAKDTSHFMNSVRDFVIHNRLDSAKTLCVNTDTPTARMIEKGITRMGKPLNDINAAIENVGKLEVAKLEKNIAWLATSAGAAPMIGFLGTVVGMVRVFFDMASKGNNIEVGTLANGMYQAMVTTVAGLIVGIIAYICYNYLISRIEKVVNILEARSTEFMDLLHEPAQE